MKNVRSDAVVAVGAVVLEEDGSVLLIKRGRPPNLGAWTLPGGRVEPPESLEAAIVREVREEAGLLVEVHLSLGVVHVDREGFRYDIHEFLCDLLGSASAQAGDDATAVRWAQSSELAALGVTPEVARVIRRARRIKDEQRAPARDPVQE
jgi:8-oxo-dGTP diphosphatase